jgi:leucyl/phenylalanyl-tRNA--protein transferase
VLPAAKSNDEDGGEDGCRFGDDLAEFAGACETATMADGEAPPERALGEITRVDGGGGHGGANADDDWPDGLVAVGGELNPDTLVRAYSSGIFPWSSDPAVTWWSPDPRAIFDLDSFHTHRSVRKTVRQNRWKFTTDQDFAGVMRACAAPTPIRPSTWITEDFIAAYVTLAQRGQAHSVEVWEGTDLVGGLYGVTLGGFFGGESMFHRRADASKAAVTFLVEHLRARGFTLLDAQVPNPHLAHLGAIEIPRADYLRRLKKALSLKVTF